MDGKGPLTYWRVQSEAQVNAHKDSEGARDSHFLDSTNAGICMGTGRKRVIEGHSRPGARRARDRS
jgi:hypothetical protein